jgi:hypothetical protein
MGTLKVKTMRILNSRGDDVITWDSNVETQVKARETFGNLLEQAYVAVAIAEDGGKTVVREFDPNALEIVMMPQISGG